MTTTPSNHARLAEHLHLITAIRRGIEKEGLRTDSQGRLAMTPHPRALGSTLTNPHITTDYSEALLELITRPHHSVADVLAELSDIHRFTAQQLDGEIIWNQSMPAHLPPEPEIPIGWYGTSNSGMLRHVYRRGLAERYGKAMQCIAGVHYNFSLPDELWEVLGTPGGSAQDRRSKGYLALIRNFIRYSWLPMYLFGASPAVSRSFLPGDDHGLQHLDDDTLYLPHATSLRMSDLGYSNKAQSDLQLCYNDVETFVLRLYNAVTTPWPAYEAIGTHRDGEWIQLNTNILQIENEYYSSIRPKRSTRRGERPATALASRGVEYVEIRCLDIDPYSPAGLSSQTARFIDTFLLFCTAEPSACFAQNGFCQDSHDNFGLVCREGRRPGLMLSDQGSPISLHDWGTELVERMRPYAELLDQTEGGQSHAQALQAQADKLRDVELTPSATLLRDLREQGQSLHDFTLAQSQAHHRYWLETPLSPAVERSMTEAAARSLEEQRKLEASDTETFDEYVADYHAALLPPAAN